MSKYRCQVYGEFFLVWTGLHPPALKPKKVIYDCHKQTIFLKIFPYALLIYDIYKHFLLLIAHSTIVCPAAE